MEFIAHRGCAAEFPENTLHAVERSSRQLPAVEVDVRRCGSGELVVCHDETVDRVTDGTGSVDELNSTQLQALDVLDSGEGIPSLPEVLAAVPPDVTVQVELKETGIGADVVATIAEFDVDARITSFHSETLAEVRDFAPDASLGYLFGEEVGVESGLDTARELDCDYLHPHAELCVETGVVDRAHTVGMNVIAWSADSPAIVNGLLESGVDGATVDSWLLAGMESTAEAVAAD